MNGEQFIHSLPPERQPVARVWADMAPTEFQARVGLAMDELSSELRGLKQVKPISQRLYEFGYAGAWIAYVLFDQRDSLPGR